MEGQADLRLPSAFDMMTDEDWAMLGEEVWRWLVEVVRMRSTAGGNPDLPPAAVSLVPDLPPDIPLFPEFTPVVPIIPDSPPAVSLVPDFDFKVPITWHTDAMWAPSTPGGNEEGKPKIMEPLPVPDDPNLLSKYVWDSGTLVWHPNCSIDLPENYSVGPMQYTDCELGARCIHNPSAMLQIFDIWLNFPLHEHIIGQYNYDPAFTATIKIDVYGTVALIDPLDYSRNYIFNRSRDSAEAISVNGGHLRLRNPRRGTSAINSLIEIDIKGKGGGEEDYPVVHGFVQAVGQFDKWSWNHVDGSSGRVRFESCVLSEGVEATIELDFLQVPLGGFHVRMCGNTSNGFFTFINELCHDSDGFVAWAGKHRDRFIAAVDIGDTLQIGFMKEGRDALSFVEQQLQIGFNEQQLYRFFNGAVVSVRVYWSTI